MEPEHFCFLFTCSCMLKSKRLITFDFWYRIRGRNRHRLYSLSFLPIDPSAFAFFPLLGCSLIRRQQSEPIGFLNERKKESCVDCIYYLEFPADNERAIEAICRTDGSWFFDYHEHFSLTRYWNRIYVRVVVIICFSALDASYLGRFLFYLFVYYLEKY